MKTLKLIFIITILFIFNLSGQVSNSVVHPEWSYDKVIYEVNLRQFTSKGTFKEFRKHIPRLKELGVGILWFMPLQPIGELNRKGTLGSYYSIKDYEDINPEFGTKEEFKKLVYEIHQSGMYVIIDWVPNHTSWDNKWVKTHPEFYSKDSLGNFVPPVPDWSDVIDLDYSNHLLWEYMYNAMEYWIKEFHIDGFRVDVAGMVPNEFWNFVAPKLRSHNIFLLAEWEDPKLHNIAFDMTYSWDVYHIMNDIAAGKQDASALVKQIEKEIQIYPEDAYRMRFVTNHDENSWNGTEFERLGATISSMVVLTATIHGMQLIYSGQEVGFNRRLSFFDKDSIDWKDEFKISDFYKKLIELKKNNPALWNGKKGGEFISIDNSISDKIFSFVRVKGDNKVLVITNLSPEFQTVTLTGEILKGNYSSFLFNSYQIQIDEKFETELQAGEFQVWISNKK